MPVRKMAREGLTTTTAGEKIGLTQVSVYYWLKKDDARLSAIAKIIEACGFRLIIDYVDPSPSSFEIITDQNRPQRLSFLAEALSGTNKAMVADSLGLGETTVYYWLSHDDIFILILARKPRNLQFLGGIASSFCWLSE